MLKSTKKKRKIKRKNCLFYKKLSLILRESLIKIIRIPKITSQPRSF